MSKHLKIFFSAFCAGIAIAIGGAIYLTLENKIVGALMFSVGLYTIVLNKLHLYTGKVGYIVEKKHKLRYARMLLITWFGNLVGTLTSALAIGATRINQLSEIANTVSATKLEDNLLSIFILSIFCGILMFVAVDGYKKTKNPLILFTCVSVFILCGFEHCVANMFYFGLAGAFSLKTLGYLIVMTVGNSLGGILLPGLKKLIKS